jgi:hypothetical protein
VRSLDPRNPRLRTGVLLLDTLILAVVTVAWLLLWAVVLVFLLVALPIWLPLKIVRTRRANRKIDARVARLSAHEFEALLDQYYDETEDIIGVERIVRRAERIRPDILRDLIAENQTRAEQDYGVGYFLYLREHNPRLFHQLKDYQSSAR